MNCSSNLPIHSVYDRSLRKITVLSIIGALFIWGDMWVQAESSGRIGSHFRWFDHNAMDVCRGLHYFIFFVEYWKINTSKKNIKLVSKKNVWIILHPNPSIQSSVAGGVEVVAGKIAKTRNQGFGRERAGIVFPAPPLRRRVNSESAEVFGSSPEPVWPFRGPTRPSGAWQRQAHHINPKSRIGTGSVHYNHPCRPCGIACIPPPACGRTGRLAVALPPPRASLASPLPHARTDRPSVAGRGLRYARGRG